VLAVSTPIVHIKLTALGENASSHVKKVHVPDCMIDGTLRASGLAYQLKVQNTKWQHSLHVILLLLICDI